MSIGARLLMFIMIIYILFIRLQVCSSVFKHKIPLFFENPKSSKNLNVYTDNINVFGAGAKYLSI